MRTLLEVARVGACDVGELALRLGAKPYTMKENLVVLGRAGVTRGGSTASPTVTLNYSNPVAPEIAGLLSVLGRATVVIPDHCAEEAKQRTVSPLLFGSAVRTRVLRTIGRLGTSTHPRLAAVTGDGFKIVQSVVHDLVLGGIVRKDSNGRLHVAEDQNGYRELSALLEAVERVGAAPSVVDETLVRGTVEGRIDGRGVTVRFSNEPVVGSRAFALGLVDEEFDAQHRAVRVVVSSLGPDELLALADFARENRLDFSDMIRFVPEPTEEPTVTDYQRSYRPTSLNR